MPVDPAKILFDDQLGEEGSAALLIRAGFTDWRMARRRFLEMAPPGPARDALSECLPMLLLALSDAATPDGSLINFERYVQSVPSRTELFRYLARNPRAVEILLRLFVGSQFLTEILLRNPTYLDQLNQHKRIAEFKSQQQFVAEGQEAADRYKDLGEKFDALRRFQHWEFLRIGACDSFGLMDLKAVTVQLSLLADSLVQSCLALVSQHLDVPIDGFAVIAMGKLGGEELNYSSDIDLIFLAEDDAAPFWNLGQRLIKALTDATGEGFLYRVDMRLRPWGRSGSLVNTVDAHIGYIAQHGMLWEKQALIKARCIAGDIAVGRAFLKRAEPLLYAAAPEVVRKTIRTMKQKIEADLERQGRKWGEVKSGAGSIRDVEFVTQFLQLSHGAEHRAVRSFNTLDGLVRLTEFDFLKADEYRMLSTGYVFFRTIEHALQLMHHKQTHSLPTDRRELAYLARRLDFADADHFLRHYEQHRASVRAIYERYLGENAGRVVEAETSDIAPHLPVMGQSYRQTFSEEDIQRHGRLLRKLSDESIVELEATPLSEGRWRLTIAGYDHLGDLSTMCGLMFADGINILSGHVFTAEHVEPRSTPATPPDAILAPPLRKGGQGGVASESGGAPAPTDSAKTDGESPPSEPLHPTPPGPPFRRGGANPEAVAAPPRPSSKPAKKFLNEFVVAPPEPNPPSDFWARYRDELAVYLRQIEAGKQRETAGQLAKRVARAVRRITGPSTALYPVEIDLDNAADEKATVLHIRAEDTIGFLYELSNALTMAGIDIGRVLITSVGNRVLDTLYVTDAAGAKITNEDRLKELRAAVVLIKHFTHLLPQSPNPEAALLHFRDFLANLFEQENWVEELSALERSDVLQALARLLGVSDFLWEDFLRLQHGNLFPVVKDVENLARKRTREELEQELTAELADANTPQEKRDRLNAFKDRAMFRSDMRHILGHIGEFGQFSEELSDVAEIVVDAATKLCDDELRERYGAPRVGTGPPCPLSVCAMGKFGGRELGFASDIELIFFYEGNGTTTGPDIITSTEFYQKLVEHFTQTIVARREGIFQIDLRLRPYGRAGSLAVSLDAFRTYFGPGGAAWPYERQALVKLRPVAGDRAFGETICRLRDGMIYTGEPFDTASMRAMREKQVRQLVKPGTFNAKLSHGGLVDTEYLVQGLQISHGRQYPQIRLPNTLQAMDALQAVGILDPQSYSELAEAYVFQRGLIDALRVVRGHAKDLTVPAPDTEEFEFLARRLGYGHDAARLQSDLETTSQSVRDLGGLLE